MVGESAGQQTFVGSIVLLVASQSADQAEEGINSMRSACSIFTDEYANKLDNPQNFEDIFRPFYRWVHRMTFDFKLVGFFQRKSYFSVDELTTVYHFPNAKYNKSPMIHWLKYKKLAPPYNLKTPTEALIMPDYVRDEQGHILTEDGSKLQTDDR